MPINKISSIELKTKIMMFFRYKMRYIYIASEVGPYNSDVLASNTKKIIEFEIKTSFSDFKNDFNKQKHHFYLAAKTKNRFVPNMFVFVVPHYLVKKALPLLKDTPYGCVSIDTGYPTKLNRYCCKLVKKPLALTDSYNKDLERSILFRMSSEICTTRLKYEEWSKEERKNNPLYKSKKPIKKAKFKRKVR